MVFQYRPLANGISTDHPIPGLPFVDDSHIPLDEGPEAIEAVGRHEDSGMWGRFDTAHDGSWRAFTTDPIRHDLGWSVRFHPVYGRTVLLTRDAETADLHSQWAGPALLFRAGGYWWDGNTWYRPGQIWHPVHQRDEYRKASAPVTVTAAQFLNTSTYPDRAYITQIANFQAGAEPPTAWLDHLALWAHTQQTRPGALPLERCVVNISSPELTVDQLIGAPAVAELAGISASTLRSYITRGENEVPAPQATIGGRNLWSKPVAADWVEARRRSAEGIEEMLSAGEQQELSPGAAEIRSRFASRFFNALWRPGLRRRWALTNRNEQSVQEVADELAWNVAIDLNAVVPSDLLGPTIRHAVLDEFAISLELRRYDNPPVKLSSFHLTIAAPVAKMLDWFIRHHPARAKFVLGEIQREAAQRFEISASLSGSALRRSLSMDGKLDGALLKEYLDRALATDETT